MNLMPEFAKGHEYLNYTIGQGIFIKHSGKLNHVKGHSKIRLGNTGHFPHGLKTINSPQPLS
jgi:hypothetical protein